MVIVYVIRLLFMLLFMLFIMLLFMSLFIWLFMLLFSHHRFSFAAQAVYAEVMGGRCRHQHYLGVSSVERVQANSELVQNSEWHVPQTPPKQSTHTHRKLRQIYLQFDNTKCVVWRRGCLQVSSQKYDWTYSTGGHGKPYSCWEERWAEAQPRCIATIKLPCLYRELSPWTYVPRLSAHHAFTLC